MQTMTAASVRKKRRNLRCLSKRHGRKKPNGMNAATLPPRFRCAWPQHVRVRVVLYHVYEAAHRIERDEVQVHFKLLDVAAADVAAAAGKQKQQHRRAVYYKKNEKCAPRFA